MMKNKVFNLNNLKRTWYYLKKNGLKKAYYAVLERTAGVKSAQYTFSPVHAKQLEEQRALSQKQKNPRRYSILVPAYETNPRYLREMIASLLGQSYPYWELVIADAGETGSVQNVISEYKDERIRYIRLGVNRGISENTNAALEAATGDYVGLLDHDDLLTRDALFEMDKALYDAQKSGISPGMLYSDEDKMSGEGDRYYEPHRKKKFNLELLLSNNYICHFMVMDKELMKQLKFRSAYDGAQDYDLALRASAALQFCGDRIVHVPRILYHWRCHLGSTAQNPASKFYAYEAGRRALEELMRVQNWPGKALHTEHLGFYCISYEPDLLSVRKDVGVTGGKVLSRRGLIQGGMMDRSGKVAYLGLKKEFSGYMHRASLSQEAWAVDVRCMKVRSELHPVFEACMGFPYREKEDGLAQWKVLSGGLSGEELEGQCIQKSLRFCEEARKAGYRILWVPDMGVKVGEFPG